MIAAALRPQETFNAAIVEYINETATERQRIDDLIEAVDESLRYRQALAARERRIEAGMTAMRATHDELRLSVGVLQQATQMLKHEIGRVSAHGASAPGAAEDSPARRTSSTRRRRMRSATSTSASRISSAVSREAIRERLSEYVPVFAGASDVLDVGCGRGEFLTLLARSRHQRARYRSEPGDGGGLPRPGPAGGRGRRRRVPARTAGRSLGRPVRSAGRRAPRAAVPRRVPRRRLRRAAARRADRARNDQPGLLVRVLRELHPRHHPRPAAAPRHAQVPDRRHRLPASSRSGTAPRTPSTRSCSRLLRTPPLADSVETLNANVEKINRLLFTCLDYAAIGYRP